MAGRGESIRPPANDASTVHSVRGGRRRCGGRYRYRRPPLFVEVLIGIVPENPIGAIAEGDVLATIFFVIVFALALLMLQESAEDESVQRGIDCGR